MKKITCAKDSDASLQPVLSYCHPSPSRGVLCFQWRGSGICFVCWYSCSGLLCINFVHADRCIQISHQRYISAVIHTALLSNIRTVGRLVLSRTSCLKLSSSFNRFIKHYVTIKTFNTLNILKFKVFYYGDFFRYKVTSSGHLCMLRQQELKVELN
jgi:hypothetical protein